MLKYVITLYNLAYVLIENRNAYARAGSMGITYYNLYTIIESDI